MIKDNILFKIISIVLICLLISENVTWADPDLFNPQKTTLAAQSIFKPILDAVGRQYSTRIAAEVECIRAMVRLGINAKLGEKAERYRSRLNINAALDKWYAADRRYKKLLEVAA